MEQKKTGYRFLGKMIKRYWLMIVIIIAMSSFDSFTYTYVPLFIKYIFSVLTNDGSFVNLPEWLKSLFAWAEPINDCLICRFWAGYLSI